MFKCLTLYVLVNAWGTIAQREYISWKKVITKSTKFIQTLCMFYMETVESYRFCMWYHSHIVEKKRKTFSGCFRSSLVDRMGCGLCRLSSVLRLTRNILLSKQEEAQTNKKAGERYRKGPSRQQYQWIKEVVSKRYEKLFCKPSYNQTHLQRGVTKVHRTPLHPIVRAPTYNHRTSVRWTCVRRHHHPDMASL